MWALAETTFLGPGLIPAVWAALAILATAALAASVGSFPAALALIAAALTIALGPGTPAFG